MIAKAVKRRRIGSSGFSLGMALLLAAASIAVASLYAQEDPGAAYYSAEKDVEVGQFYMRKGDVDAAITRFQDAIKQKPNFARPRLLLGEAYEKKGEKAQALKYYKEYLEILPKAPDASKIRKRIEKLTKALEKDSSACSPLERFRQSVRDIVSPARNG